MEIDTIGRNKLKISLSDEEIFAIFGGYENFCKQDSRTKKAINLLIKSVAPKEMLPLNEAQALIEIKPEIDGCAIYFTKLYESNLKKLRRNIETRQYTLCFDCIEDLIAFIVCYGDEAQESSLYKYEDTYCLIIKKEQPIKQGAFAKEFCFISESGVLAEKIKEYGTNLCKQNALEKLKETFKKL